MKKKWILCSLLLAAALIFTSCGEGKAGIAMEDANGDGGNVQEQTVSFGDFEAELYGGGVVNQEIFAEANLTMVSLWATYCGYCIQEMPYYQEFAEAYKDEGLQVVGIVTDAQSIDDEAVGQIIDETGAAYRHIVFNRSMLETYMINVQAVPTTLFVNRKGEVIQEVAGARGRDFWEKTIEELL